MASTTSFPPGPLRVENVGVSAGGTRIQPPKQVRREA